MSIHKLPANYGAVDSENSQGLQIISGWKDIASYLGSGVRTVQRYERNLSLPVHRVAGKARGAVVATKAEIDAWVTAKPIRKAFQSTPIGSDTARLLHEFRQNIRELHRLREETKHLREQLHISVELVRASLQLQIDSSERRLQPDMLMVDATEGTVH